MPEDEEELLKAIYGVVDKLKGDVYYALVYAVLDRVLKPLGLRALLGMCREVLMKYLVWPGRQSRSSVAS